MLKKWIAFLPFTLFLLSGCHNNAPDANVITDNRGHRYEGTPLLQDFHYAETIKLSGPLNNADRYAEQTAAIATHAPSLYQRNSKTYHAISRWIASGADHATLANFGLKAFQMKGVDNWGNVHFTGYFTPVIKARQQPNNEYRYPIYRLPPNRRFSRAEIYRGALANQSLEIAYTRSLIDNFFMEVQGSAYLDFENGQPLNFYAFAGKNGHSYSSIGRVLIDQGEIEEEAISMQAIKAWLAKQDEKHVIALLNHNKSFVYFKAQGDQAVKGASSTPLIALTAVAADRRFVAPGSVLLAEVPRLSEQGQFTGQFDVRLMVALDVGGAIKGHHFDIYQGIGDEAGQQAGFYNHYGRVWILSTEQDDMHHLLTTSYSLR